MSSNMIGIIVILVLILVVFGIAYYAYIRIRNKVREFSRMAFGTTDLAKGVRQMEQEVATTPKSVSAATNLYLPMITKDFPEFHFSEMKERAENVLVSFLRAIDSMNPSLLTEGTSEFKEQLATRIDQLRGVGEREHYQKIRVHRTEIHQYRKLQGRRSIVMQSAVEYLNYVEQEQDGKVVRGSKDQMKQAKYNVELIYIQDRDIVENSQDTGLGLNCPNCGAPLPSVGARVCAYCDTPVMAFNIRVWNFSKVEEVR